MSMSVQETVSGKFGSCYLKIDGRRYNFLIMKNVKVQLNKDKSQLNFLGRSGSANKTTGLKGTFSGEYYWSNSILIKKMLEVLHTGKDFYFDMDITTDDPTSSDYIGRNSVTAYGCNLDGVTLAQLDVDNSDGLTDDFKGTFEDATLVEGFSDIAGM